MQLIRISIASCASRTPRFVRVQICCCLLLHVFIGTNAVAASYQPDLMVRLDSEGDAAYLGAGIFEAVAGTQSKSQAAFAGQASVYRVLLQNASGMPDGFLLKGSGSTAGVTVRYLDEWGADRSAAFTGAGFASGTLAPGGARVIQVQVTPLAPTPGASYRTTLTATSLSDPGKSDQVKMETVACAASAAVTVSAPPDGSGPSGSIVNYPYTVSNVGNSVNSFSLSIAGSTWPAAIYADDGAGGGVAEDGIRQSGENLASASTGPLAPGASYRFFVSVSIPAASVDGTHADTRLAVTGEGASASDQVTTSAVAAVISVAEDVRNLTQGGPFAVLGNAVPGDTLEYRMTVTNSGSVAATAVSIDNNFPANTAVVPGTLWIGTSSGGDGPPCAAASCGQAGAAGGSLVAHLGEGATDVAGGVLKPARTLYVYFRVQVQ